MKFSDGQSEFSQVFIFNFAILLISRNSWKSCEKLVFYSSTYLMHYWPWQWFFCIILYVESTALIIWSFWLWIC